MGRSAFLQIAAQIKTWSPCLLSTCMLSSSYVILSPWRTSQSGSRSRPWPSFRPTKSPRVRLYHRCKLWDSRNGYQRKLLACDSTVPPVPAHHARLQKDVARPIQTSQALRTADGCHELAWRSVLAERPAPPVVGERAGAARGDTSRDECRAGIRGAGGHVASSNW